MAKTPQYEAIEDDLTVGRTLLRLKVKVFDLLREKGEVTRQELVESSFEDIVERACKMPIVNRSIRSLIRKLYAYRFSWTLSI